MNMFVLDAPSLSFDPDYNYIGAAGCDTMKPNGPS